jgi:hypothetical protein
MQSCLDATARKGASYDPGLSQLFDMLSKESDAHAVGRGWFWIVMSVLMFWDFITMRCMTSKSHESHESHG